MSDLDIINFMMIDDVNRSTKNQQLLTDLQGKAAYLEKKSGQAPLSWYEFQQIAPKEEPKTFGSLAKGVLVGGAIGALVGLFALPLMPVTVLTGAFLGGVVGVFGDTETVRRDKQVKGYEQYLNEFELAVGKGRAPSIAAQPEQQPQQGNGHNVERLQKERAALAATMAASMNTLH